jgi:hypothetical protein
MECWWCHHCGHMKRECNKWNQAGKPQGRRRGVTNVAVDHNRQSNKGDTPRQHRKEAWLVRNGHDDDVCLLNMDICLTMIEDDGKIQEIFDKDDTYIDKDDTYIDKDDTYINEEGIEWDLKSMASSKINMEGIEETKIEGLQELNLKYESSSTGTTYANQSVMTEGSICSIQSWEHTDDLAMPAVTGHENEGLKMSNSMDEEIYYVYGSEEENNMSEVPRLMNMNYKVEATQFIQPPEMRRNGRDLHPSMLRLNWENGIHLPEKIDENESTASSDLFASLSNEKETMNCFVKEEVLTMNPNIGQEGLTRNQYSNIIDEFSIYRESDYPQREICMMVTEDTSDTDTIMHSNKDLKKPPENNPWHVAKLPDHSQDPLVLALSCT